VAGVQDHTPFADARQSNPVAQAAPAFLQSVASVGLVELAGSLHA